MEMDEQTKAFLSELRERSAGLPSEPSLAQTREAAAAMARTMGFEHEEVARVEEHVSPGGVGLRVYVPGRLDDPAPVVVWAHGGNWTRLSVDDLDHHYRVLANRSRCAIAAVRTTRAPEARLPVAIEQLLEVTGWLHEHGSELGLDVTALAIGGESSGGNLAAAAARVDRDRDTRWITLQILLVPVLDARFTTDSWRRLGGGAHAQLCWGRDQYAPEVSHDDPRLSPGRATDLAGLPPALIVAAELDPLRDEAVAYAQALRGAGIEVELVEHEGLIHPAILAVGRIDRGRRAVEDTAGRFGRLLRSSPVAPGRLRDR